MKKGIVSVCFKPLLLLCAVCTFSGCFSRGTLVSPEQWITDRLDDVGGAIFDAAANAVADAKTRSDFAKQRSANPLESPVESRLTRRTSTLAGGIPVDISPYLVHNYSIAVTEKGIQRGGSDIKITEVRDFDPWQIRETNAVITFNADKKSYQKKVIATTCGNNNSNIIIQHMKEFAAGQLGLEPGKLQDFEAQFTNKITNKGRLGEGNRFAFDNIYIQENEPCSFQFDVEVEYQKQEIKKGTKPSESFAVFSKTYSSDLMTVAGAAFEVQAAIWKEACELSALKKETPLPVINVVRAVKIPDATAGRRREEILGRAQTDIYSKRGVRNPLANSAEERLTRRTSALTGGMPIDVSRYLLNEDSFAVTENGIMHYDSILENVSPMVGYLFEFDLSVTFEADSQNRKMNVTAALCKGSKSDAQKHITKYMQEYAAGQFGLDPNTIKNFKVQFLKTRTSKYSPDFRFDNVFVHDIEPCYYQFDVEVEYQKKKNVVMGFTNSLKPEHFGIFNKVYRSDFTTEEAAAIDVQRAIKKDASKKVYTDLPVINVVKAVKVKI